MRLRVVAAGVSEFPWPECSKGEVPAYNAFADGQCSCAIHDRVTTWVQRTMKLLEYLASHFLTEDEITAAASSTQQQLLQLQDRGCMPRPSYVLAQSILCRSFFGDFNEEIETRYYAKDYVSWLAMVMERDDPQVAFQQFRQRYSLTLDRLRRSGLRSDHDNLNASFDAHVQEEWKHFLNGTYGLCTKSGLPEDIASKEMAILIIKEISEGRARDSLSAAERERLRRAVTLLDEASSPFAPHEVERSSRNRFIVQIRDRFGL